MNEQLSLSQPSVLRLPGITYLLNGQYVDPRPLVTIQFQLVAPTATTFGTWVNGTWESNAPVSGPYAATILVGASQPAGVNPGTAGTYQMFARFETSSETPAWPVGVVTFTTP